MAWEAGLFGLFLSALVATVIIFVWRAVGPKRRQNLWKEFKEQHHYKIASLGLLMLALLLPPSFMIQEKFDKTTYLTGQWTPLVKAFPNIEGAKGVEKLQIQDTALTDEIRALVSNTIDSYKESKEFCETLKERVPTVQGIRLPEAKERTAVIVADRHDNIGMDQVARAVGDKVGAGLLMDLGDDTSSGGAWEVFSVNSLAENFQGYEKVVVNGNHDRSPIIQKSLRNLGFVLMDGQVTTVGGLRFLGFPDPRETELGKGYLNSENVMSEEQRQLNVNYLSAACGYMQNDLRVDVILSHSPHSSKLVTNAGCGTLALSGHTHQQAGPETFSTKNGDITTLTVGTTGGASYSFAGGSKLRRDAQVGILTYENHEPQGLQMITFLTSGEILVGRYFEL
jgi:hypothetical protein